MTAPTRSLPFRVSQDADPGLITRFKEWLGPPDGGVIADGTGLYLDANGLAVSVNRQVSLRPDLTVGPTGWRLGQAGIKREALARAAGLGKGHRPTVIDATAGLGCDGLVLAQLGCPVTLIERQPAVAALLDDALRRAASAEWLHDALARSTLMLADGARYLASLCPEDCPDVVYLDPMFVPARRRGAAGKETQLLAALTGEPSDGIDLLGPALKAANARVVVKRHRHAAPLGDCLPTFHRTGKSTRFDVYITG